MQGSSSQQLVAVVGTYILYMVQLHTRYVTTYIHHIPYICAICSYYYYYLHIHIYMYIIQLYNIYFIVRYFLCSCHSAIYIIYYIIIYIIHYTQLVVVAIITSVTLVVVQISLIMILTSLCSAITQQMTFAAIRV